MRCLSKPVEGLVKRSPIEIVLRLCVGLVAPRVDLVATGAEQRRGKEFRYRAEQARGKVDRRGRSET